MTERDRISRIEGFEVACDMPAPAGNALRVFSRRGALLIRLSTEAGHVGWGETWAFPGPASAFIQDVLAPDILGRAADAPLALQQTLLQKVIPDRRGQAHMAISAIDIACWDLFGRMTARSVSALQGGPLRRDVLTYASGPLLAAGVDRYTGFGAALERYRDLGFRAFKIRVGIDPDQDERAIRLAREIVGPEAPLMIDLNEASTLHDAIELTRRVSDCHLGWVEEPLPHDDLPGYRRLAGRMNLPISGGESFCGVQAFRDSMQTGALDIVQPDIALCGGITETLRISALADAFGVRIAPHVWGTGVNMLAALQVCALLRSRAGSVPMPMLEYDMSHNPLREAIFAGRPDANGLIAIPEGPGLGHDISVDQIDPFITRHWMMD
ncbi:mandelate racemase/muconate lactonizing enzyme family protein [Martelella mediterranea]|uniref:D-galactarolactone cycloisomerase n=1 Tax=Martelella mediterranea TaxID=293089 RepID=A0A4R3NFE2_9HYPH|nr:mandelate racemase/muconate lactonizing enzyme family protein [Martelella mediterranea]TCT28204.1 D-galactarolactone cycloisomerase [Martelella mediterranea]